MNPEYTTIFNLRILPALVVMGLLQAPLQAEQAAGSSESAQPPGILATQGDVVLTQDEIDAAFSRIPPEHRLVFIRDGERVNQLVYSLLRTKLVAAEAIRAAYDGDRLVKNRMALAAEQELAEAWMAKIMAEAPQADYAALAYENYLVNPGDFQTEEMLDVSHILVNTQHRSKQEALELATSIRAQLNRGPSQFADFILQYSDDPAITKNQGRYPQVRKGQMVGPFEAAAFALENEGDISVAVETTYGYHIIRLNRKYPPRLRPFEEVKADQMAVERKRYRAQYRARYLNKLLAAPVKLPEDAVEAMVKRHFGDNLELAPDYNR